MLGYRYLFHHCVPSHMQQKKHMLDTIKFLLNNEVNFTVVILVLVLFFKHFFIVVQVQFSAFFPTPPHPPPLFPPPPPPVIVHVSFRIVPANH